MSGKMDQDWPEPRRRPIVGWRPYGNVSAEERERILARWDEARATHSKECAIFARVKQTLPPRDRRNQSQIVMYELALQRYKAACAAYYKERELMNYEMFRERKEDAIEDVVQQLRDVIQGIPTFDVPTAAEIKKRDQIRDAIADSGDFDTIRQAALQRSAMSEAALDLTDEIMDMDTPADALVATQAERAEARAAMPPVDAAANASEAEPDTPEALIQKYGIPEAPR